MRTQKEKEILEQRLGAQHTPRSTGPRLTAEPIRYAPSSDAGSGRAFATIAVLALSFVGVNWLPSLPEGGDQPSLTSGAFNASPPVTLTHWLGLALAVGLSLGAATYPTFSHAFKGGIHSRGLGLLGGLVLVLFAYGNVAHSHSISAALSYTIFSMSLIVMVILQIRHTTVGQDVTLVGLLLGAFLSAFVSTNSFLFCGGVFFSTFSAVHMCTASGKILEGELKNPRSNGSQFSPRRLASPNRHTGVVR